LRDQLKEDPDFIEKNKESLCASLQKTIIDILMDKTRKAIKQTGVKSFAIAGGVSANSGLRIATQNLGQELNIDVFMPEFSLTTDNAAMIAITGYYKYLNGEFAEHGLAPLARMPF
jgi:N6-L-threonylcarbamoyladenine synthase